MHNMFMQVHHKIFILTNHIPSGKKREAHGLNAGGQISLSCHKEIIKLTHYLATVSVEAWLD